MESSLKVSEIFLSIQGEGRYLGVPMLFIRLSGCTRKCPWCDSSYHWQGREVNIDEVISQIVSSRFGYVCWTGGEAFLQRGAVCEVIKRTRYLQHHIETNGDLLTEEDFYLFQYLVISPKEGRVAKDVSQMVQKHSNTDIKVVTDLDKVGVDLIPYATMLMPLSTYDADKDLEIQRKVWNYCVEHNMKFTPRCQVWIWGKKRGV